MNKLIIFILTVFSLFGEENNLNLQELENTIKSHKDKWVNATICIKLEIGGSGSGVIVNKDGLILSAAHVTGKAGTKLIIVLNDGTELPGVSLGQDPSSDSSMAKITKKGTYNFVEIEKDKEAKQLDWCFALGHGGGYKNNRLSPIRIGRILRTGSQAMNAKFLLSDATVVMGDSGGPLFGLNGKLIGIHSNISGHRTHNRHVPMKYFLDNWENFLNPKMEIQINFNYKQTLPFEIPDKKNKSSDPLYYYKGYVRYKKSLDKKSIATKNILCNTNLFNNKLKLISTNSADKKLDEESIEKIEDVEENKPKIESLLLFQEIQEEIVPGDDDVKEFDNLEEYNAYKGSKRYLKKINPKEDKLYKLDDIKDIEKLLKQELEKKGIKGFKNFKGLDGLEDRILEGLTDTLDNDKLLERLQNSGGGTLFLHNEVKEHIVPGDDNIKEFDNLEEYNKYQGSKRYRKQSYSRKPLKEKKKGKKDNNNLEDLIDEEENQNDSNIYDLDIEEIKELLKNNPNIQFDIEEIKETPKSNKAPQNKKILTSKNITFIQKDNKKKKPAKKGNVLKVKAHLGIGLDDNFKIIGPISYLAKKAGLKAGDKIIRFDSRKVGKNEFINTQKRFILFLKRLYEGDTVAIRVLRDNEELDINYTLASKDKTINFFKSIVPGTKELNSRGFLAQLNKLVKQQKSCVYIQNGHDIILMGTVVSNQGHVLTKASELNKKNDIICSIDKHEYLAEIITIDKKLDLALLKVEELSNHDVAPVVWSNNHETGDLVISSNRDKALSFGIITTKDRTINKFDTGEDNFTLNKSYLGIKIDKNNIITDIAPRGPAEKAGLQKNDKILKLNNKEFTTLTEGLKSYKPKDKITLTVQRKDKTIDKKATLAVNKLYLMIKNFANNPQMSFFASGNSDRKYDFETVITHDSILDANQMGFILQNIKGEAIGLNIARATRIASFALPAKEVQKFIQKHIK